MTNLTRLHRAARKIDADHQRRLPIFHFVLADSFQSSPSDF